MDTGYFVRDRHIYGPSGDTRSYIDDTFIYAGANLTAGGKFTVGGKLTGYWVADDGDICRSVRGSTHYRIEDGNIYGPDRNLPWL
jgi:hypothetical protein